MVGFGTPGDDHPFAAIREEFAAVKDRGYLDIATRAPTAIRVTRELEAYLADAREGGDKLAWLEKVEQTRVAVAHLINAAPDEVAFVANTSTGINTIAHALALRPGDNVVISPEVEHGNNVYPWLRLRTSGVEVRTAKCDGMPTVDSLEPHVDSRTRVIAVSSVSFVTGARCDLAQISQLAHAYDAFLLVDAVQGLGIVEMDMQALGVDGACAATQKGLLGIYGLGVLYCSRRWADRLTPPFLSRNAIDLGPAHESEIGELDHFDLKPGAGRFEVGNPNFAGIFALSGGLSLLAQAGPAEIEAHVTGLAASLIAGLDRLGVPVVTPADRSSHAGIVSFRPPYLQTLLELLDRRSIRVAVRRGYVRASMHLYNSQNEIDQLLECVAQAACATGTTV